VVDLVIHVSRVCDGIGYLVAKKAAVSLTEAMYQAFHRRFGQSQSMRPGWIRYLLALRTQTRAQRFKSAQSSLTLAFFSETSQRLLNDCSRPPQIEKALVGPGFQRVLGHRELRRCFSHPFIPGDELDIPAPLARMPFLCGIVQEVLERLEQKRSEAAPARIGTPKPVTFEHHNKKILGEILCILLGMTASADKREDWTPIEPAEFRKCLLHPLIVASETGRCEDETPPCCSETASFSTTTLCNRSVHDRR
jgi:hypothetical protein